MSRYASEYQHLLKDSASQALDLISNACERYVNTDTEVAGGMRVFWVEMAVGLAAREEEIANFYERFTASLSDEGRARFRSIVSDGIAPGMVERKPDFMQVAMLTGPAKTRMVEHTRRICREGLSETAGADSSVETASASGDILIADPEP